MPLHETQARAAECENAHRVIDRVNRASATILVGRAWTGHAPRTTLSVLALALLLGGLLAGCDLGKKDLEKDITKQTKTDLRMGVDVTCPSNVQKKSFTCKVTDPKTGKSIQLPIQSTKDNWHWDDTAIASLTARGAGGQASDSTGSGAASSQGGSQNGPCIVITSGATLCGQTAKAWCDAVPFSQLAPSAQQTCTTIDEQVP